MKNSKNFSDLLSTIQNFNPVFPEIIKNTSSGMESGKIYFPTESIQPLQGKTLNIK
jgi:hypothetical protein